MNTLETIIKKFNLKNTPLRPGTWVMGSRNKELLELYTELGFKLGAEIGVEAGIYSEEMCKSVPNLTLYSIDPWKAYGGYREHVSQEKLEALYKTAYDRLKPYNCYIIRDLSENAHELFQDESLDFVYIDGNHDFLHVTNDLEYWSRKVKKGGIVGGHDYIRRSGPYRNNVKDVIPAFAYANGIREWFILREPKGASSWFWVKP
jgi:hypothetical protein